MKNMKILFLEAVVVVVVVVVVDVVDDDDNCCRTALLMGIDNENLEMVELLLENKVIAILSELSASNLDNSDQDHE